MKDPEFYIRSAWGPFVKESDSWEKAMQDPMVVKLYKAMKEQIAVAQQEAKEEGMRLLGAGVGGITFYAALIHPELNAELPRVRLSGMKVKAISRTPPMNLISGKYHFDMNDVLRPGDSVIFTKAEIYLYFNGEFFRWNTATIHIPPVMAGDTVTINWSTEINVANSNMLSPTALPGVPPNQFLQ